MDVDSSEVTITTVSGGGGVGVGGGSAVVDVTGTLCLPPAYDTLLPLYDNKHLPNYHDVCCPSVSHHGPPPSYDSSGEPGVQEDSISEPSAAATSSGTQQTEDGSSTPVSQDT